MLRGAADSATSPCDIASTGETANTDRAASIVAATHATTHARTAMTGALTGRWYCVTMPP